MRDQTVGVTQSLGEAGAGRGQEVFEAHLAAVWIIGETIAARARSDACAGQGAGRGLGAEALAHPRAVLLRPRGPAVIGGGGCSDLGVGVGSMGLFLPCIVIGCSRLCVCVYRMRICVCAHTRAWVGHSTCERMSVRLQGGVEQTKISREAVSVLSHRSVEVHFLVIMCGQLASAGTDRATPTATSSWYSTQAWSAWEYSQPAAAHSLGRPGKEKGSPACRLWQSTSASAHVSTALKAWQVAASG